VTTSDGTSGDVSINGVKQKSHAAPGIFIATPGTNLVRLSRKGHSTIEGVATKKVAATEIVDVRFTWQKP
jgi:hypothetical protein